MTFTLLMVYFFGLGYAYRAEEALEVPAARIFVAVFWPFDAAEFAFRWFIGRDL